MVVVVTPLLSIAVVRVETEAISFVSYTAVYANGAVARGRDCYGSC